MNKEEIIEGKKELLFKAYTQDREYLAEKTEEEINILKQLPDDFNFDLYINGGALKIIFNLYKQLELSEQKRLKAIEYIKKRKHLDWYVENCYKNELLEILGEGNE